MLHYALLFFVLALIAAVFGFGGIISGTLMGVAKILVLLFVVLFVISLFTGRTYNEPLP